MNKLSIEELIKYAEEKVANLTKVIDQSAFTSIKERLIEELQLAQVGLDALRSSLKGDQVPVAWRMWPEDNYEEGFIVNHDEDPVKYPTATDAKGQRWVSSPLYDRPQKPVEVSDSVTIQNVKDIAHCLSDIRRFVEAKFMTVGDLPSPEGLLLSGPEWKHESDAIIAALNRVADFYEQQKPVELTVWYGSMPESNGKSNWTAILHRKGEGKLDGMTIDRSEYPERVLYAADRVRYLIGEKPDRPYILNYDAEKHSGYVGRPKSDLLTRAEALAVETRALAESLKEKPDANQT